MEKIDYSDIHLALVFQVLECYANRDITSKEFPFDHHLHGQNHLKYSTPIILSYNGYLCVV